MIRVPLGIKTVPRRFPAPDGGGTPVAFTEYRVVCPLLVGAGRHLFDAWIDTGAPVSVFPQRVWRAFSDEIDWVDDPGRLPREASVGGVGYPFHYGRVPVGVISADLRTELPPLSVLAMFTRDGEKLPAPLIGLTGGVLAGRRLVVEPDLAAARLEAA